MKKRVAMKLLGILSALLGSVLSCPLLLGGQAPQGTPASTAAAQVYPDQGYLSPSRYVSRYFGFALDFPSDLQLEPIPQPVARDERIQMLQLGGPAPNYASVSAAAFPLHGKSVNAKSILRGALDQELFLGVEELHGLSKMTLSGHLFYFYETRRGVDRHMALATDVDGYAVLVVVAANDENVVKRLEAAVQHIAFLAPAGAREYAGADAKEYDGPAISAHRLAELKADPPANHIDPGEFSGSLYQNQGLGLTYSVPPGWTREPEGAILPAIERAHQRDFEDPWLGNGERELMKLCDRTLFSTWAKRPGPDGQVPYDDFGEVTLSAASTTCFPGMKLPANVTDRRGIEEFLRQFRLTHPILREMRDAKAFGSSGNVIVYLHGTVAFQVPNDALSRRLSIAMALTVRRGYLLTWFFAAPHDSELRELTELKVTFDNEPFSKEASATKPGGGEAAPSSSRPAEQTATGGNPDAPQPDSEPIQAANASSQPQAPDPSGNPTRQPETPAASASSPPTLLRPGETMQDQQIKGQPLPQKH